MKPSNKPIWIAAMFILTFMVLFGMIIVVLISGEFRSMMALSGVAYAVAAMGFLSVIGWAYGKGQFVDYEQIKESIFELEARE